MMSATDPRWRWQIACVVGGAAGTAAAVETVASFSVFFLGPNCR